MLDGWRCLLQLLLLVLTTVPAITALLQYLSKPIVVGSGSSKQKNQSSKFLVRISDGSHEGRHFKPNIS